MWSKFVSFIVPLLVAIPIGFLMYSQKQEWMADQMQAKQGQKLLQQELHDVRTKLTSLQESLALQQEAFSVYKTKARDRAKASARRTRNLEDCLFSDGYLLWNISSFTKKLSDAKRTKEDLDSPVVCRFGYHLQLKLALNGDWSSDSKGKYISAWLYNPLGPFDRKLHWPFVHIITVKLLARGSGNKNIEEMVIAKQNPGKFGRPDNSSQRNIGYGMLQFAEHAVVKMPKYLQRDTLYFEIQIGPTL